MYEETKKDIMKSINDHFGYNITNDIKIIIISYIEDCEFEIYEIMRREFEDNYLSL